MRLFKWGAIAGIALASSMASATPARVVGMGGIGQYIEDDTNVLTYPSQMARYAHFFFIDLPGNNGIAPRLPEIQSGALNGGAYLRLGEGFSLGVLTSSYSATEQQAFFGQLAGNSKSNGAEFLSLLNGGQMRRYDLLAAFDLSREFSLGLRFSYGGDFKSYIPDSEEREDSGSDNISRQEIRLGLGLSGNAEGIAFDGGLDYTFSGLTDSKNSQAQFVGGNGNLFGINARARIGLSRSWDLIPQIAYRVSAFGLEETKFSQPHGSASTESPTDDNFGESRKHDRVTHDFDLGVAVAVHNMKKSGPLTTGSSMLTVATGIRVMSATSGVDIVPDDDDGSFKTETTTMLPLPYVRVGLETFPLEWLKLRGGLEKHFFAMSFNSVNQNRVDDVRVVSNSSTSLQGLLKDMDAYVGASLLLAGFSLDMSVASDFWLKGRLQSGGAYAGRASLSYHF